MWFCKKYKLKTQSVRGRAEARRAGRYLGDEAFKLNRVFTRVDWIPHYR